MEKELHISGLFIKPDIALLAKAREILISRTNSMKPYVKKQGNKVREELLEAIPALELKEGQK